MMNIGYARTSTIEQKAGFDAQVRDLRAAGCCERDIYREQVSSVAERPELELVLSRVLREGDTLIVTKLDRLARSVADLVAITARLKAISTGLKVLDSPIDTTNPYGELVLNVLGAIAQFEREIMLARQREGIAAAKAAGKYKGRTPTAQRQAAEVRQLAAEGVGKAEIARRLAIGERSVYRILASLTATAATASSPA